VRPGSDTQQLEGLPVERLEGDLQDADSLRRGVQGCDWVFHVAALYAYWGYAWEEFYQTNVEGTRNLMQASLEEGVERVVYTSSIAVLGSNQDGTPATEEAPSSLEDRIGPYQRSKFLAEEVARDFAREGLPVVIVNPSTPVGAGDHKPTPTGQIIVDFLNGRMFGYLETGLNVVDVDVVAAGHLLAAERGRLGERYILGGENLTLKQVLDILAEVSGRPPVSFRVPRWLALSFAYLDTGLARLNQGRTPTATPDKVRLSRRYEWFDTRKAVEELGLPESSSREAFGKAVEWYRANGYASE
jgi:dihydroflavonol-4-reductase